MRGILEETTPQFEGKLVIYFIPNVALFFAQQAQRSAILNLYLLSEKNPTEHIVTCLLTF